MKLSERQALTLLVNELLYLYTHQTEVEFFLNHWNEIRASDVLKNVWIQIRNGKHPGFEQGKCIEIWTAFRYLTDFASSLSLAPHCPAA
jgi:hypothetical protein